MSPEALFCGGSYCLIPWQWIAGLFVVAALLCVGAWRVSR